jgi:cytochrome d ubiquinol oxidase subunit II
MMAIGIASSIATVFLISYPNVLTATDPQFSISIQEAASSTLTLQIMTGVAVVFVPIVIAYQVWVYWLFRHRVGIDPEKLTY